MILLDTDTVTLASQGKPQVLDRLAAARQRTQVAVPLPVRLEILRGRIEAVLKANQPDDVIEMQRRFHISETFLQSFSIIDFDESAKVHFIRLVSMKSLRKIGIPDLLIACIALAHDATLVTRNLKDFAPVPRLRVENWSQ